MGKQREKRRGNLCGDGILVTSDEFWNAANCRSGLEFLLIGVLVWCDNLSHCKCAK